MRLIQVGWEHEVPITDVEAARSHQRVELEEFYCTAVRDLTDEDVARFLVRVSHPSTHYLRADVRDLGFTVRFA